MATPETILQALIELKQDVGKLVAYNEANFKKITEHESEIKDLRNSEERRKGASKLSWIIISIIAGFLGYHVTISK